MIYPAAFAIGFLLGMIPFGLFIAKGAKGIDIREHGSGNIGATNVARVVGRGAGISTFLLDVVKGLLPALLFRQVFSVNAGIAAGIGAIAGHIFSPLVRFKGGKGVATSLGVFIGLAPIASAVGFGVWVVFFLAFRWVSLASIMAALGVPVFLFLSRGERFSEFSPAIMVLALIASLALIVRHAGNVKRLFRGKEPRFSWTKDQRER
jgi:glycerol-3-phosphate acyltransferase PlsY